MELGYSVDMDKVAESDVFPAGESVVAIQKIEQRSTKSGGWMWVITMMNDEGQMIVDRLICGHSNPEVVQMNEQKLLRIAKACKLEGEFNDTDQLLSRACVIQVQHEYSADYGTQPKIKKYKSELSLAGDDDQPY